MTMSEKELSLLPLARCSSTASARAGQAWRAQSPNGRSVSAPNATPASGSTHKNPPTLPEVAEGAGAVPSAGPVRVLRVAQLRTETPIAGSLATEAREHAIEAAKRHRRRPLEGGR